MTRNTQPHLLSIEAIIQKSQFSRAYQNIPTDLKRIVLDELVKKDHESRSQHKVSKIKTKSNFFPSKNSLQSLPSYSVSHRNQRKMVPPLPNKEKRINSLNSSKKNICNIESGRKPESSRSNEKIISTKNKKFMYQTGIKFMTIESNTKEIMENLEDHFSPKREQPHSEQRLHRINNKLSRYQFQIPIPQGPTSKIRQSLSNKLLQGQIYSKKQNKTSNQAHNHSRQTIKKRRTIMTEEEEQIKFEVTEQKSESNDENEEKTQEELHHNSDLKELEENEDGGEQERQRAPIGKSKQKILHRGQIPNCIIQAVEKQQKIPRILPKNFEVCFNTVQADKNKTSPIQKTIKEPKPISNMKRRMSYRHKKSEESELQPQANLIRLLSQKQKYLTKPITSEEVSGTEIKKKSGRMSAPKKDHRKKKFVIEENVCGWEVKDTPMFFDHY